MDTITTENPEACETATADTFSRGPFLVLSAFFFAGLIVAVAAFARYGEPYAARLSGAIGEIESQRAASLYEVGQVAEAVAAYENALTMRFDDPRQRGWALRRFGQLLLEEKRPEEALPWLEECLAAYPSDLIARELYANALRFSKRYDLLVTASEEWAAEATRVDNTLNRARAQYSLGTAYEGLGDNGAALKAYQTGHTISSASINAYHAAVLLEKQGERQRALEMLDAFLEHGTGWRATAARKLREKIQAEP